MCATALPIAKGAHAYAVKTGNNTLAKSVDFSMSDLIEGRDLESRDNCQNIYNIASTNLANLAAYGVTAAKLAGLNATIATYNLLISKPRDNRAIGMTVTANLQAEFDAANVDLEIMDDMSSQITDPTFVSNYKNARIIVDTAASHASSAGPTPPVPIVPPIPPVTPAPSPVNPNPTPLPTNS